MVRIFVYSNRLIRKHELVIINSVGKTSLGVFKTRVSFRIVDILRLLDKEDLPFTLADNVNDDNDCELYLVLDTYDNRLIESFSTILNLVLSFA